MEANSNWWHFDCYFLHYWVNPVFRKLRINSDCVQIFISPRLSKLPMWNSCLTTQVIFGTIYPRWSPRKVSPTWPLYVPASGLWDSKRCRSTHYFRIVRVRFVRGLSHLCFQRGCECYNKGSIFQMSVALFRYRQVLHVNIMLWESPQVGAVSWWCPT